MQIGRFEVQRRHDMRQMFIEYLESLVQTHTEVILILINSYLIQELEGSEEVRYSLAIRNTN